MEDLAVGRPGDWLKAANPGIAMGGYHARRALVDGPCRVWAGHGSLGGAIRPLTHAHCMRAFPWLLQTRLIDSVAAF